jgi:hypothetical protein
VKEVALALGFAITETLLLKLQEEVFLLPCHSFLGMGMDLEEEENS